MLQALVDQNTVIVIEHQLDVIKAADWIVDLGPEVGIKRGGRGHRHAGSDRPNARLPYRRGLARGVQTMSPTSPAPASAAASGSTRRAATMKATSDRGRARRRGS
jgi:hypothetical protein